MMRLSFWDMDVMSITGRWGKGTGHYLSAESAERKIRAESGKAQWAERAFLTDVFDVNG